MMMAKFEFYECASKAHRARDCVEKVKVENWNIIWIDIHFKESKVRKLEVETIKKIVQQYMKPTK